MIKFASTVPVIVTYSPTYGSGLLATELAATGTSGLGGVFAAGGACRAWPAVIAVNEVTNAASARAATITVDLVERCMNSDS